MGNDRPTLYIGITSNLAKRVWEHQNGAIKGFTQKYRLKKLLYFEVYSVAHDAIAREKQLKWREREWKIELIRKQNPNLDDLTKKLMY